MYFEVVRKKDKEHFHNDGHGSCVPDVNQGASRKFVHLGVPRITDF